jgi:hypothetical protein
MIHCVLPSWFCQVSSNYMHVLRRHKLLRRLLSQLLVELRQQVGTTAPIRFDHLEPALSSDARYRPLLLYTQVVFPQNQLLIRQEPLNRTHCVKQDAAKPTGALKKQLGCVACAIACSCLQLPVLE